jgi:hypothetical protein
MRKKTLMIVVACAIVLVVASLFVWTLSHAAIPQKYERTIARNIDSPEEENTLAAVESVNYSAIFSTERFEGSSDPEAYLHSGTYLAYTYANFIDSEVLNYYETRYDDLQGKGTPKQIQLTYQANVTQYSEIQVYKSPAPKGATWHNNTIVISAPDGLIQTKDVGNMQFFCRNQSGYQTIAGGFDFNFSDCQVVEMKLVYSETYAPLAAFWSDTYQIVILDRNLTPILVGVDSGKAVA